MRILPITLFAILHLGLGAPTFAQKSAPTMATLLDPLLKGHNGQVSVAVRHLGTGESFDYRADEPMPTASLIKVAVMAEAYRQIEAGTLRPDDRITIRAEDQVPGSGILTTHFSPGTEISLRDAIHLMIGLSDNTATNLVLDKVTLPATAQTMEVWGYPHTKIHAKVFRADTSLFPERSARFGLGSTTAREMLQLLESIHHKTRLSPKSCEAMWEHLLACDDKSKLARRLPATVPFAHKTGAVGNIRCDAGVMVCPTGPVGICVLTRDNADESWGEDNQADLLCAQVAQIVYEHFHPAGSDLGYAHVPLRTGASGELVTYLQRTLNARLVPSPSLNPDGEFGPKTLAAVIRFQKEQKLAPHGEVDELTWKALGTLVTADQPVPAPDIVNQLALPQEPPESLQSPPVVTCRSWAIGDGKSGAFLWGTAESEPSDPASTTKIMTALLVIRLAEVHPQILSEGVTFSAAADSTIGSTADVRATEQLPVKELLYGLLLPSGNDAAVALAEHFAPQLAAQVAANPSSNDHREIGPSNDAHDRCHPFVAAMNRVAAELDLKETQYRNTHGLSEEGHVTSARDLLKLSHAAMQYPLFRQIVATRQHGFTISGPGGYQRNLLWKNTNRLLGKPEYDGIKTGTTDAAGCCLVSRGQWNGDPLIVVVLGAPSDESRYADTRNLFRWAWRERSAERTKSAMRTTEWPPVAVSAEAAVIHNAGLPIDRPNDLGLERESRMRGVLRKKWSGW